MADKIITLQCIFCKKSFDRLKWQYRNQVKNGNIQNFCSRRCFGQYSGQRHKNNLIHNRKYTDKFKQELQDMKFLFGKTHQEIASELDIPLGSISYLLRSQ